MSKFATTPHFLRSRNALHRMVLQYDPVIGQRYVPGINARVPNELGGYYIRTNSSGFRSDVEFCGERSGRPRIVFLGDSYTAGFWVSNGDRFSDLVGQSLDAEVYNYAVTGTGTDQQLLIYEHFAANVEADLIVFGVFVENIERNLRTHHKTIDRYTGRYVFTPKPYFNLEDDQLVLHHSPVPLARPETAPENFVNNDNDGAPARVQIVDRLRQLYYNPKIRPVTKYLQDTILSPALRHKFLRTANYQPYPDYLSEDSYGWQLMKAILQRFTNQITSTPVLIIPIPSNYFFRPDPLEPVYQARFEALENNHCRIHVADVTSKLKQLAPADRMRMTFEHDAHFSPFGNRQMADIVAREIVSRNLLPEPKMCGKTIANSASRQSRKAQPSKLVLGISCFYHNSAACLISDGDIVAAAEEERFTRVKNDRNFPHRAINYCMEEAGIQQTDLDAVVYYDNAYLTFERLIWTQVAIGRSGEDSWMRVLPSWLRQKLIIPSLIRRNLNYGGNVLHTEHHRSHAASAFYPSPFDRAAIVTIDGVGEWATASIGVGHGREISLIKEMDFPNSLGMLYSAFTQFVGFKVNDGEYKMMGLAPYGEPKYVDLIYKHLVDLKDDGSVELNMEYFSFLLGARMTNEKFADLFGGPGRQEEDLITQREMDISRSIQVVTEDIVLRMAQHAYQLTAEKYLCIAGGVALNCVANGRLLREGPFENIWIQPAAGDSGCALGAALDVWHNYFNGPRPMAAAHRSIQGASYLGPSYHDNEIKAFLDTFGYPHRTLSKNEKAATVARHISEGRVVGFFSGRMEYGPRALGGRSILGDATNEETQTAINLKIKYRESFRPFAPSVLAESVSKYFEMEGESPYMLLVAPVNKARCRPQERIDGQDLLDIVRQPRSDIPAVTHVDYSARVQTVNSLEHRNYYDVIKAFEQLTGYGVIVNTSFNVRGEPIVCTPFDAYRCFMRTEMDVLVLNNHILLKEDQPPWPEAKGHLERDRPAGAGGGIDGKERDALSKIFHQDFLPAAAKISTAFPGRIALTMTNAKSTWNEVPKSATSQIFEIPSELDGARYVPEEMASSILRYWQPTAATDELKPVVVKLLDVGSRLIEQADQDEFVDDVPDFVYAMY